MIEQLESRTLLAAAWPGFSSDPGESTSSAADIGNISGARRYSDSLGKGDRSDYIRFEVANRGNLNVSLTGLKNDADIQLSTASGAVLSTSDNAGKKSEGISRFINAGSYYLHISGAPTGYKLSIQADVNWGTVSKGGETRDVGLVFSNDSTQAFSAKKETWVLIGGWTAPGRPIAISRVARAIDGLSKKDQVMLLDWSHAASTSSVAEAASWAPAAAQFAAQKLASWGVASSKVNILAHSLGALVGNQIAASVKGDVNRIIALDPATESAPVNFSESSRYSTAFVATDTWATGSAAATADETFKMNIGPRDSLTTHNNMVDVFATIVADSRRKKASAISKLLSPSKMIARSVGRFQSNAFEGVYEGVIDAEQKGSSWVLKAFSYKNKGGKTIVVR
jgi:pimeloyl-ACP methyl ester carboxylesterase